MSSIQRAIAKYGPNGMRADALANLATETVSAALGRLGAPLGESERVSMNAAGLSLTIAVGKGAEGVKGRFVEVSSGGKVVLQQEIRAHAGPVTDAKRQTTFVPGDWTAALLNLHGQEGQFNFGTPKRTQGFTFQG